MKRSMVLAGGAVVAALALIVAPAAAQKQKLAGADADFIKEAAEGGMLEVKLGQYAMDNAGSEAVKKFAKRMVDDHGKASMELKTLAADKNVTLPTKLDKKSQETYDKLAKLKGTEFDKEYMRHMVEDHEKDVAKFQSASKNLQDPDLKAWALKTLPTLNEHLRMAKDIHGQIEKKGG